MPSSKSRWLVVLPTDQYEWIKGLSAETKIKGSHIISEIIGRVMEDNPKRFKQDLAKTQYKMKLQALNDKKADLAEEERELRKLINDGITV